MFGPLPAYGLYCRHVEGLTLRDIQLNTRKPDMRHAVVLDDVKQVQIERLQADRAEGAAATIEKR